MEWRSEQFPVFCLAKSSCSGFSLLREWGTAANSREHCFGAPAKRPRLVTAGGHYATTIGLPTDDDGLAPQLRMIPLLHRRIDGIHVDMDDLANMRWEKGGHPNSGL